MEDYQLKTIATIRERLKHAPEEGVLLHAHKIGGVEFLQFAETPTCTLGVVGNGSDLNQDKEAVFLMYAKADIEYLLDTVDECVERVSELEAREQYND